VPAEVTFDAITFDTTQPNAAFPAGHVYVAGSRNAEVFEYDAKLEPVTRWTHASFGTVLPAPGQDLSLGPQGMVFDDKGNLVVASVDQFCVFDKPGQVLGCHPKVKPQPTENIIFDHLGNLYTTTSTGGTNEIHKYDASYQWITTFPMQTGELTGITCDPDANLYVASQYSGAGRIYKLDKTTLAIIDTIDMTGTTALEGLQFAPGPSIFVGVYNQGIRKVKPTSPMVDLGSFSDPGLLWPVPVTIDNAGNVYTADYENGSGTAPADLFVFDAAGKVAASRVASEVYGPFGMVVAGTFLPCGALRPPH